MKSRFLFPHQFRLIGVICIIAYVPLMVIKKVLHNGYKTPIYVTDPSDLLNSEHVFTALAIILLTGGIFFIAFSKERIEDEQISQLRLDSLQWAIYLNYFILIITVIFSDIDSKNFGIFAFWVPLVFFIIRFKWKIYQLNRLVAKEGN